MLEDPWAAPPEEPYALTSDPSSSPEPIEVTIGFERGVPVSLDGEELALAELIARLNGLAGGYGIGRLDMIENRAVGIKSREVYEAPAAIVADRGALGARGRRADEGRGADQARARAALDRARLRGPLVQPRARGDRRLRRHDAGARRGRGARRRCGRTRPSSPAAARRTCSTRRSSRPTAPARRSPTRPRRASSRSRRSRSSSRLPASGRRRTHDSLVRPGRARARPGRGCVPPRRRRRAAAVRLRGDRSARAAGCTPPGCSTTASWPRRSRGSRRSRRAAGSSPRTRTSTPRSSVCSARSAGRSTRAGRATTRWRRRSGSTWPTAAARGARPRSPRWPACSSTSPRRRPRRRCPATPTCSAPSPSRSGTTCWRGSRCSSAI